MARLETSHSPPYLPSSAERYHLNDLTIKINLEYGLNNGDIVRLAVKTLFIDSCNFVYSLPCNGCCFPAASVSVMMR